MKNHRPIVLLATTAPFSNAQAQQLSETQLSRLLKRFPAADANGDGKLTQEEFNAARKKFRQSRQGGARPGAASMPVFDPGWEKEKFPPHAVSLKTPEEIMAIYKRGPAGQTPLHQSDAGKTMKGMVTFEGKPAAETIVTIQPANSSVTGELIAAVQSDKDGKFTIRCPRHRKVPRPGERHCDQTQ